MSRVTVIAEYDDDTRVVRLTRELADVPSSTRTGYFLQVSVGELRARGADAAEQLIGASVLSCFDTYSGQSLDIRDYKQLGTQFLSDYHADIKRRAREDEPAALFEAAMTAIDQALREGNSATVPEIEVLLRKASSLGSTEATRYLETDWSETMRLITRRRT